MRLKDLGPGAAPSRPAPAHERPPARGSAARPGAGPPVGVAPRTHRVGDRGQQRRPGDHPGPASPSRRSSRGAGRDTDQCHGQSGPAGQQAATDQGERSDHRPRQRRPAADGGQVALGPTAPPDDQRHQAEERPVPRRPSRARPGRRRPGANRVDRDRARRLVEPPALLPPVDHYRFERSAVLGRRPAGVVVLALDHDPAAPRRHDHLRRCGSERRARRRRPSRRRSPLEHQRLRHRRAALSAPATPGRSPASQRQRRRAARRGRDRLARVELPGSLVTAGSASSSRRPRGSGPCRKASGAPRRQRQRLERHPASLTSLMPIGSGRRCRRLTSPRRSASVEADGQAVGPDRRELGATVCTQRRPGAARPATSASSTGGRRRRRRSGDLRPPRRPLRRPSQFRAESGPRRRARRSRPCPGRRRRPPAGRPGVRHRRRRPGRVQRLVPLQQRVQGGPRRGRAVSARAYVAAVGHVDQAVEPDGLLAGACAVLHARHPLADPDAAGARVQQRAQQDRGPGCPRPAGARQHQRPARRRPRRRDLGQRQLRPLAGRTPSTRIQRGRAPPEPDRAVSPGSRVTARLPLPSVRTRTSLATGAPRAPAAPAQRRSARRRASSPPATPSPARETQAVAPSPSTAAYGSSPGRAPPTALASEADEDADTARDTDEPGRGEPPVPAPRAGSPASGCPSGGRLPAWCVAESPSWHRPKNRSRRCSPSVSTSGRRGAASPGSTASRSAASPSTPASVRSSRSSGPPTTPGGASLADAPARPPSTRRPRPPGRRPASPPSTSSRRLGCDAARHRRPRGRTPRPRGSPATASSAWCTSTGSGTSSPRCRSLRTTR